MPSCRIGRGVSVSGNRRRTISIKCGRTSQSRSRIFRHFHAEHPRGNSGCPQLRNADPDGFSEFNKGEGGETTNDIYAFLTTEPNAEVGAIHPKAMRVILTTPDEVEAWMTAPPDEALKLQRPLPDGALRVVAPGVKEDPAGPAT